MVCFLHSSIVPNQRSFLKHLLRFFTFFILVTITCFFQKECYSFERQKGTPILDSKILNSYIFDSCYFFFYHVEDGDLEANQFYLKEKMKKTKTIKVEEECWMTISAVDLEKKKSVTTAYSIVSVQRYSLDSPYDASLFADAFQNRWRSSFSEGSYSMLPLGDKCWSDKNSRNRNMDRNNRGYENGLKIIFLKNSTVVKVDGHSLPWDKNLNPMPPEFVEKIARAIDNKLK